MDAVEAFNRGPRKRKITALTRLIDSGTSNAPRQVAKDISTLLAEERHLPKDVVATFSNMKRLLKGVTRSILVGES